MRRDAMRCRGIKWCINDIGFAPTNFSTFAIDYDDMRKLCSELEFHLNIKLELRLNKEKK